MASAAGSSVGVAVGVAVGASSAGVGVYLGFQYLFVANDIGVLYGVGYRF